MTLGTPIHPGRLLREEFLPDYGLTGYALAQKIGSPRSTIEDLLRERRSLSAAVALRLARLFGTTPQYWMNMQSNYELALAARDGSPDIVPLSA